MECAVALPLMTTGGCDRVCGSIAADDDGTVALPVAPMVALMKLQPSLNLASRTGYIISSN